MGENVIRPEKISGAPPVYTEMARKSRVQGVVIIESIVDEQGNVVDAKILKGLPMGLDLAAQEAVKTWKFKPATLDGQPVKVYYTLTVNFQVGAGIEYGPAFQQVLTQHRDFVGLVRGSKYAEAEAMLTQWASQRPDDPQLLLARSYLLLERGDVKEAWDLARSSSQPAEVQHDVLVAVGSAAVTHALANKETTDRPALVELGLEAVEEALELRQDSRAALNVKLQLLWEKRRLATDATVALRLDDEIKRLQEEIRDLPPGHHH
jgi:TonB family protein